MANTSARTNAQVLPMHLLVGVHGAGLVHTVFLDAPCRVLELHFELFQAFEPLLV